MKLNFAKSPRAERAFTMIEIAIAIGVIGFALVAIIGILPTGMNSQKDNREDTIISQDAPYFLNAIRNGEMRTNNNVLANYVETIFVTNVDFGTSQTNYYAFTNPKFVPNGTYPNQYPVLTNDMNIIGLLSFPQNDVRATNGVGFPKVNSCSNFVAAIVRAMSGSALQQNGANDLTAFRYQVNVENMPWYFNGGGYTPPFAPANAANYDNFMMNMLHEVRLKFSWPVNELPNGSIQSIGEGRRTYRTVIAGHLYLTNTPPPSPQYSIWFFQPANYTTNTNGY